MFLRRILTTLCFFAITILIPYDVLAQRAIPSASIQTSRMLDRIEAHLESGNDPSQSELSDYAELLTALLSQAENDEGQSRAEPLWRLRYLLGFTYFKQGRCQAVEGLYPKDYQESGFEQEVYFFHYFTVRGECLAKEEGPKEAAKLSTRIGEKLLSMDQAEAAIVPLSRAGVYLFRQAQHAEAIGYLQRALALAKQYSRKTDQARIQINLGGVYTSLEENEKAIMSLTKGMELAKEVKSLKLEAFANSTIGAIYLFSKQAEKAKTFYLDALSINETINDHYGIFITNVNLSIIEEGFKNFDNATAHAQRALSAAKRVGAKNDIGNALLRLGGLYMALEKYEESERFYQEALSIYQSLKNIDRLAYTYTKFVDLTIEREQYDEALALSEQSRDYVFQTETPQIQAFFYALRIKIFKNKGDYKAAFEAQEKYREIEKSLYDSRRSREFEDALQKYAAVEREKELAELKSETRINQLELEKSDMVRNILVFGLAIACIVSVLLLKLYRESKQKSISIERQRVALEEAHSKLQKVAMTDELTRILNRRAIMKILRMEWERSRRLQQAIAVVLFDIDHFKSLNDSFGHDAGDHVLQQLAFRIDNLKRQHEQFARWGGEEFILVLPQQNVEEAQRAAERIRQDIENWRCEYKDCSGANHVFQVTLTLGCADNAASPSLDSLIKNADLALYEGKAKGRNRIEVYGAKEERVDA